MKRPELDDLIEGISSEERERLQHVHELLLEAGPPPDLPPKLARPPGREPLADVKVLPRGLPRRRLAAAFVLAAAIAAAAFGSGYIVGDRGGEPSAVPRSTFEAVGAPVRLEGDVPGATAVVRVGAQDRDGNLPMLLTTEGLERLPAGDYYILYMTEKGEPPRTQCGTFNVRGGNKRTLVRFTVGYDLEDFNGFALVLYRLEGHTERTLMTGKLT